MLAPAAENQTAAPPYSHPRRLPAHLSISLHHKSSSPEEKPSREPVAWKGMHGPSKLLGGHQSSRESNKSGESTGLNLQKWFDYSNERPHTGLHTTFQDSKFPRNQVTSPDSIANHLFTVVQMNHRISCRRRVPTLRMMHTDRESHFLATSSQRLLVQLPMAVVQKNIGV